MFNTVSQQVACGEPFQVENHTHHLVRGRHKELRGERGVSGTSMDYITLMYLYGFERTIIRMVKSPDMEVFPIQCENDAPPDSLVT